MNSKQLFPYKRLKNKSLCLLCTLFPEESQDLLQRITNKRFKKCYSKVNLSSVIQEINIKKSYKITCLIKIDNNNVAYSGNYDSYSYSIFIYNLNSGKFINTLLRHYAKINSLLRINKTILASGSSDETIRIWNYKTRNCLLSFLGHSIYTRSIIKLNNCEIITCGGDSQIKLWDYISGNFFKSLGNMGEWGGISSIVKLNNNKIASGCFCSISIWDLNSGKCLNIINCHYGYVTCIIKIVNQNSTQIATASEGDTSIKIWDLEKENGKCLKTLLKHNGSVISLVKLDFSKIASAGLDHCVYIWDLTTGSCIKSFSFNGIISMVKLNHYQLIVVTEDCLIKVFDFKSI